MMNTLFIFVTFFSLVGSFCDVHGSEERSLEEQASLDRKSVAAAGITGGNLERAREFLARGRDAKTRDYRDQVNYWLQKGARDMLHGVKKSREDEASFHRAFVDAAGRTGGDLEIVRNFLDFGADVNTVNYYGDTLAIDVTGHDYRDIVNDWLRKGATISDVNNNNKFVKLSFNGGFRALMNAARSGNCDIVKLLLQRGANVNAANCDSKTALSFAICNGHYDVVDVLLRAGADVNAVDNAGSVALKALASKGHREVAEFLLKKGVNVDLIGVDGDTDLLLAAGKNCGEVAALLLQRGADKNVVTNDSRTAITVATN